MEGAPGLIQSGAQRIEASRGIGVGVTIDAVFCFDLVACLQKLIIVGRNGGARCVKDILVYNEVDDIGVEGKAVNLILYGVGDVPGRLSEQRLDVIGAILRQVGDIALCAIGCDIVGSSPDDVGRCSCTDCHVESGFSLCLDDDPDIRMSVFISGNCAVQDLIGFIAPDYELGFLPIAIGSSRGIAGLTGLAAGQRSAQHDTGCEQNKCFFPHFHYLPLLIFYNKNITPRGIEVN